MSSSSSHRPIAGMPRVRAARQPVRGRLARATPRARRGVSLVECIVAAALLAGAALTLGSAQAMAWRAVTRAGAGLDTVAVLRAELDGAASHVARAGCDAALTAPVPPLALTRAVVPGGVRLRLCADSTAAAHRCLARFAHCEAAP